MKNPVTVSKDHFARSWLSRAGGRVILLIMTFIWASTDSRGQERISPGMVKLAEAYMAAGTGEKVRHEIIYEGDESTSTNALKKTLSEGMSRYIQQETKLHGVVSTLADRNAGILVMMAHVSLTHLLYAIRQNVTVDRESINRSATYEAIAKRMILRRSFLNWRIEGDSSMVCLDLSADAGPELVLEAYLSYLRETMAVVKTGYSEPVTVSK